MRVEILAEDTELAECLPDCVRSDAQAALWAARLDLPAGEWRPPDGLGPRALGFLVLDGVLTREVTLAGGAGAELLGRGDVLRPWDDDRARAPVPPTVVWRVLEPARVAVLDGRFTGALCAYPDLVVEFQSRLIRRARWLACLLAISEIHRLEPRLLVVLWHLADRWGSVGPDGVCLPLSLTHRTLGCLVGAQRPSVTRSLRRLEDAGALSPRAGGGWILHGEPMHLIEARFRTRPVTRVTAARATTGVPG